MPTVLRPINKRTLGPHHLASTQHPAGRPVNYDLFAVLPRWGWEIRRMVRKSAMERFR